MQTEYLLVLGACLAVTLPLELVLGVRVYRQPVRLAGTITCVAAVFVTWDLAGARMGHWDYAPSHLVGLWLLGLPLEEYLFFLVVPLCSVLAYEAVRRSLPATERRLAGLRARLTRRDTG